MFYKDKTALKYFWAEVVFFLFLAYINSVISDLEYSYYEQHDILKFTDALEYRLVTGTFSFAFYGGYYWLFIKRYVFEKKIFGVVLSMIAFVLLSQLYDKYVMYGSISKMGFVSESLRAKALRELNRKHIYFTVNYILRMVIIPIIGFAFLVRSLQQDEQLKTLKEQQLSLELHYLKAQLHPHFFFNTINNIYSLALKQSPDTAPIVAKLGEMMRYILYVADQITVPLTQEIAFLTDYVTIEKIRYPAAANIQFDVQGINDHAYIQPLLLLPFIENAFKHGLQEETAGGYVYIVICLADKELTLEVSNSKAASAITDKAGIGLQNVIKRLDILYPGDYKLDIKNDESIYQVFLTLHIT